MDTVTEHEVAGSFVDDNRSVAFTASKVRDKAVFVDIAIDSRTFSFEIDFADGLGDFDSALSTLAADDLTALVGMATALETAFPGDHNERGMLVQTLIQQTSFLAAAPVDQVLGGFDIVAARSITCIGSCSCSNQYIGNGVTKQVGKAWGCTGGSGNGCKGRCGAGCGSNMGGYYTWDCGRHDYNLESWWAASDDYSFGWNCSC